MRKVYKRTRLLTKRVLQPIFLLWMTVYAFLIIIVHVVFNQQSQISIQNIHNVQNYSYNNNNKNSTNTNWWLGVDTNVDHLAHHPRQGAEFEGQKGMIVNPSTERLEKVFIPGKSNHNNDHNDGNKSSTVDITQFVRENIICPSEEEDEDNLIESKSGHQVLQKVKGGLHDSIHFLNSIIDDRDDKSAIALVDRRNSTTNSTTNTRRKRKSKILCMVYTAYTDKDRHKSLRAQAHTWGKRCDGFIGASNFTDHSIGAINLLHDGVEAYGNMWQKVRSIWAYAYLNYINDYDFFYICGDDVYVAVENMRAYVDGPEVELLENGHVDTIHTHLKGFKQTATNWVEMRPRPLIFGAPYLYQGCPRFGGGGGYILNREALKVYYEHIDNFLPDVYDSREDIFLGGFFCDKGIFLVDTRSAIDGGIRFGESARYQANFEDIESVFAKILKNRLGVKYKLGIDSASKDQIAFHLKDDKKRYNITDLIYRYDAFLYDSCPKNN